MTLLDPSILVAAFRKKKTKEKKRKKSYIYFKRKWHIFPGVTFLTHKTCLLAYHISWNLPSCAIFHFQTYVFQPVVQVFAEFNNICGAKSTQSTQKLLHTSSRAALCNSFRYSPSHRKRDFPPQIPSEFLLFVLGVFPHSLFASILYICTYTHIIFICYFSRFFVKVFFITEWVVGMWSQFEHSFSRLFAHSDMYRDVNWLFMCSPLCLCGASQ